MSSNPITTTGDNIQEDHFGPFAVVPKTDCPHVENRMYTLPSTAQRIDGRQPPCTDCGEQRENWACLQENCSYIGCSRYQQKHMLEHNEQTGHRICFSFSDLSFFCYGCESYIDSPHFTQINQQLLDASQ